MSKKIVFLSSGNKSDMAKRVYAAHQNEGGERDLKYFQRTVPSLMNTWTRLDYIDSYESLTEDPEIELEQINQDFYSEFVPHFRPAAGYRHVKKLETRDDYLNYDIQREPDPVTNSARYREDNRIPAMRKWVASRNYARDADGLKARELEIKNKETPGMSDLWARVNQPVRAIDDGDVAYYGQSTDDDASTLINTSWN